MSKFGGGGVKCAVCNRTSYPAETIQFEKISFHAQCFKCFNCDKKLEGPAKASKYEENIYCNSCFSTGNYAQKQRNVTWTKGSSVSSNSIASKFGGGGTPCTVCATTVYSAEQISFEKKVYHPDCFQCTTCSKKMNPSDGAQYESTLYCRKCFQDGGFAVKQATSKSTGSSKSNALASKFGGGGTPCAICSKTVYPAEQLSYDKKAYHSNCFKCAICSKKMTVSNANTWQEPDNPEQIICDKCWGAGEYALKQAKCSK